MSEQKEKRQVGLFGLNIEQTQRLTPRLKDKYEVISWAGKSDPMRTATPGSYDRMMRGLEGSIAQLRHTGGLEDRNKVRRHIITSGNENLGYELASRLDPGDIVASVGEPMRGWKNSQQMFNEYRINFLDLAILYIPGGRDQVLVGGDQRGYLGMLDLLNAIAAPNGTKQLISEVIGSGHAVKDFYERRFAEIGEIVKEMGALNTGYSLYPDSIRRILGVDIQKI